MRDLGFSRPLTTVDGRVRTEVTRAPPTNLTTNTGTTIYGQNFNLDRNHPAPMPYPLYGGPAAPMLSEADYNTKPAPLYGDFPLESRQLPSVDSYTQPAIKDVARKIAASLGQLAAIDGKPRPSIAELPQALASFVPIDKEFKAEEQVRDLKLQWNVNLPLHLLPEDLFIRVLLKADYQGCRVTRNSVLARVSRYWRTSVLCCLDFWIGIQLGDCLGLVKYGAYHGTRLDSKHLNLAKKLPTPIPVWSSHSILHYAMEAASTIGDDEEDDLIVRRRSFKQRMEPVVSLHQRRLRCLSPIPGSFNWALNFEAAALRQIRSIHLQGQGSLPTIANLLKALSRCKRLEEFVIEDCSNYDGPPVMGCLPTIKLPSLKRLVLRNVARPVVAFLIHSIVAPRICFTVLHDLAPSDFESKPFLRLLQGTIGGMGTCCSDDRDFEVAFEENPCVIGVKNRGCSIWKPILNEDDSPLKGIELLVHVPEGGRWGALESFLTFHQRDIVEVSFSSGGHPKSGSESQRPFSDARRLGFLRQWSNVQYLGFKHDFDPFPVIQYMLTYYRIRRHDRVWTYALPLPCLQTVYLHSVSDKHAVKTIAELFARRSRIAGRIVKYYPMAHLERILYAAEHTRSFEDYRKLDTRFVYGLHSVGTRSPSSVWDIWSEAQRRMYDSDDDSASDAE